jgi:hypothetical protein
MTLFVLIVASFYRDCHHLISWMKVQILQEPAIHGDLDHATHLDDKTS